MPPSPRVHLPALQAMEKQLTQESGNKLDAYEMEVLNERADVLKDLAEFQLAVVGSSWPWWWWWRVDVW
jgi:hypothetical protein